MSRNQLRCDSWLLQGSACSHIQLKKPSSEDQPPYVTSLRQYLSPQAWTNSHIFIIIPIIGSLFSKHSPYEDHPVYRCVQKRANTDGGQRKYSPSERLQHCQRLTCSAIFIQKVEMAHCKSYRQGPANRNARPLRTMNMLERKQCKES